MLDTVEATPRAAWKKARKRSIPDRSILMPTHAVGSHVRFTRVSSRSLLRVKALRFGSLLSRDLLGRSIYQGVCLHLLQEQGQATQRLHSLHGPQICQRLVVFWPPMRLRHQRIHQRRRFFHGVHRLLQECLSECEHQLGRQVLVGFGCAVLLHTVQALHERTEHIEGHGLHKKVLVEAAD